MSAGIRPARPEDAEALWSIKRALPMRPGGRGGFLLGADVAGYAALIAAGQVWVMERRDAGAPPGAPGSIRGFAIALPDPVLRASDVWARRGQIEGADLSGLESSRVGYFDQLAVLPGARGWAAPLGLKAIAGLARDHDHVFCTTVRAPVFNAAALSLIERIGFRRIGRVDEVYPEVGPLVSDVHHVDRGTILARLEALRAGSPAERGAMARAGL